MLNGLANALMNKEFARRVMESRVESIAPAESESTLEKELKQLSEAVREAQELGKRIKELRSRIKTLRGKLDSKISALERDWEGVSIDAPRFEKRPVPGIPKQVRSLRKARR